MKTILIIIALVLVGCVVKDDSTGDATLHRPYETHIDTIHGHSYLTTKYGHGASTIHAEHCKCKEGK